MDFGAEYIRSKYMEMAAERRRKEEEEKKRKADAKKLIDAQKMNSNIKKRNDAMTAIYKDM